MKTKKIVAGFAALGGGALLLWQLWTVRPSSGSDAASMARRLGWYVAPGEQPDITEADAKGLSQAAPVNLVG